MDEQQQQCYKPYSHIIMYLKLISQDNFKYLKYQHAFFPGLFSHRFVLTQQ